MLIVLVWPMKLKGGRALLTCTLVETMLIGDWRSPPQLGNWAAHRIGSENINNITFRLQCLIFLPKMLREQVSLGCTYNNKLIIIHLIYIALLICQDKSRSTWSSSFIKYFKTPIIHNIISPPGFIWFLVLLTPLRMNTKSAEVTKCSILFRIC